MPSGTTALPSGTTALPSGTTALPSGSATASKTPAPGGGGTLDPSAQANSGEVTIAGGFIPDPHSVSVTSGGPIDASYIEDCRGFAMAAANYEVTYSGDARDLLRFYVEAEGDTTLVINGPDGSWSCNDDYNIGIFDPVVDFEDPATGIYDIWVGSYDATQSLSGTLFVTELSSNEPSS